ncbi:class II aldolase/adducin family protein [Streptomyces sp. NPDC093225]|uniref:class II aldolase/adducin family protein n=1 Tax=Streptomyces sp. NPDC093225 TaxID=3366034 RepID=UPI00380A4E8B
MSEQPQPVPAERLRFAMPPRHGTPAEERAHRKERLAGALRLFAALGYEDGVSGHVTARDPEFPDCYWVNPFGRTLAGIGPEDLVLADGDGRVLQGEQHVNQAAFEVHAAVHRARPGVVAVAHAHSDHGRAFAALGELLDPITQEACAFYQDHALLDRYTGPAAGTGDARLIAAALGSHKALVLRNHGLLTVGDSVDAAAWWFVSLDRSCGIQLAARAAGKPVPIDHKSAVLTREQLGTDLVAWISFQPLWQRVAGEPGPAGSTSRTGTHPL